MVILGGDILTYPCRRCIVMIFSYGGASQSCADGGSWLGGRRFDTRRRHLRQGNLGVSEDLRSHKSDEEVVRLINEINKPLTIPDESEYDITVAIRKGTACLNKLGLTSAVQ